MFISNFIVFGFIALVVVVALAFFAAWFLAEQMGNLTGAKKK